MPEEKAPKRKEKRRYTFVIIPDIKSEKTRTFSITRFGFFILVLGLVIVLFASVLAAIVYTPLGANLPISNPELTRYYKNEILEIQKQMQHFIREIMVLRNYNLRLRKIMGEGISPEDSALMLTSGIDTSFIAKFKISDADTNIPPVLEGEPTVPIQTPIQASVIAITDESQKASNAAIYYPLLLPVNGFITRDYEPDKYHYGIDIASKQRTPVFAAANGTVVFANWTYEDGFMIMITHEYGVLTVYKHNYSLLKDVGDVVKRGEVIALLGNTGERSSGPHLHFEVWKNGVVQDPNQYLLNIN